MNRIASHRIALYISVATCIEHCLVFTEEYASKVDIFEHGGLEPLIRLISSPDCDVQVNSRIFEESFRERALEREL